MAKRTARTAAPLDRASVRFSAINGVLLAAAFISITLGYTTLAKGSTVAAPLLIVLGYAVLLPLAIIL